jgi:cell division protein ZapA (FtsZ GTPase activity inhibitor)
MSDTPTPRTDAKRWDIIDAMPSRSLGEEDCVGADLHDAFDGMTELARELERELAEAEKQATDRLDTLAAIARKLDMTPENTNGKTLVSDHIKGMFDDLKEESARLRKALEDAHSRILELESPPCRDVTAEELQADYEAQLEEDRREHLNELARGAKAALAGKEGA